MEAKGALHMNGGHGENSYSKNSYFQEVSLQFLLPYLEKCLDEMHTIPCEVFRIADLGCSTGPNTIFVMEKISRIVSQKYQKSITAEVPEIQAFFSDLPTNDFNTLIRNLSVFHYRETRFGTSQHKDYLAAVVAGSFHDRLFPKKYIHFIHSSYSLHWLSKVPSKVEDWHSSSWNGEHVYISKKCAIEVANAYLNQFKKDLNSFLKARAEEMVVGGCMFIYMSGRDSDDLRDQGASGVIGDILDQSLHDIVDQGVIEEYKRETFNLPFFAPSVEEVQDVISKVDSFRVKKLEYMKGVVEKMNTTFNEHQASTYGEMVAKQFRAILEGLVSSHFGENIMDVLFSTFASYATKNLDRLLESNSKGGGILFILEKL